MVRKNKKEDWEVLEGEGFEIIYRNKITDEYFNIFGTKINFNVNKGDVSDE